MRSWRWWKFEPPFGGGGCDCDDEWPSVSDEWPPCGSGDDMGDTGDGDCCSASSSCCC